jgi:exodeoxyribonuclease V alpha subunit
MAANNNPTKEVFAGLVERVTFHNEDNGFCVLRVKARGKREPITVVGHAAVISASKRAANGPMIAPMACSSAPGF